MKRLVALVLLAAGVSLSADEKVWTPEAMMRVVQVMDVQASPSGNRAAYTTVHSVMTETKSEYVQTAWIDNNKLIEGGISKMARWSPDGERIAFLVNENGVDNLYIKNLPSGTPNKLSSGTTSVQAYRWAPNSQEIAYVRKDPVDESQKRREKTKEDGIIVGSNERSNSLWVVNIHTGQEKQLTRHPIHLRGAGDFGSGLEDFDWSPDSREIVFGTTAEPNIDCYYLYCGLAVVEVKTGKVRSLPKKVDHESVPRFSPDGNWIAFLASDQPATYGITRHVAIMSRDGSKRRKLAKTPNEGSWLTGPSLLGWSADGKELLFFEPSGTEFKLFAVPADGSAVKVVAQSGYPIYEPSLNPTKTHIGFVSQETHTPPEAYVSDLAGHQARQKSKQNSAFADYPAPKTQKIRWTSKDGTKVEGLLTYPVGYKKGKRYPLLVVVHGGPMIAFNEYYLGTSPFPYPLAAFAQEGYLILRPNPRGSTGYGRDFRYANYGDLGGKDYEDIMAGVDFVLGKRLADRNRMGIMGWSYGGYMTAWVVTQNDRFAAASMGAGLSNLTSMAGTTDIQRYTRDYMGKEVWEDPALYAARSPVTHAQKVKTPLLIQHGEADTRVPVSQGYEFYNALKRQGKPVRMVVYPRAEHRPTEPKHMLDILESNLAWFNGKLK